MFFFFYIKKVLKEMWEKLRDKKQEVCYGV
jgi:hypothetical protein